MNKEKLKKIGKITANVLIYLFLAVCVIAVALTLASKRSEDGAAKIFGHQLRTVLTESMEKSDETDVSGFRMKSIPKNSMILVQCVPEDKEEADKWYSELRVGDVLTFRYVYTTQITITHRITAITEKETGGYIIDLEGDNKSADSTQLVQRIDTSEENSPNYVIGKVVSKFVVLGFIVSLLKQPMGLIFIVIVPCIIVIILEVLKILSAYNVTKAERAAQEVAKKDSELEELKRRLAALEGKEKPAEPGTDPISENNNEAPPSAENAPADKEEKENLAEAGEDEEK